MKSERISRIALRASKVLIIFVFLGITGLLAFGYRITRELRGAQTRSWANRDWDAPLPSGPAREMTEQVATTFARCPYPESFFTWRGGRNPMPFFSRATRLPRWMPPQNPTVNFPIALA